FNRLVGERISIVEDSPGVTRDRIYAEAEWLSTSFNVIDTGGIDIGDEPLLMQIREQAEVAIEEADVIVFIVNGREGITAADEEADFLGFIVNGKTGKTECNDEVAKIVYKADKPVVPAVNKIDNTEMSVVFYD